MVICLSLIFTEKGMSRLSQGLIKELAFTAIGFLGLFCAALTYPTLEGYGVDGRLQSASRG